MFTTFRRLVDGSVPFGKENFIIVEIHGGKKEIVIVTLKNHRANSFFFMFHNTYISLNRKILFVRKHLKVEINKLNASFCMLKKNLKIALLFSR